MTDRRVRLLVTRPEPDAQRSAELLRGMGHAALVAPLLRFEMIPPPPLALRGCAGLIVTSANALRAAAEHPHFRELADLLVFAVGTRTAELARDLGFASVADAQGSADDLVAFIRSQGPSDGRFVHLTGEDRARDIGAALAPAGLRVDAVALYRMPPVKAFAAETEAALRAGTIDAVLHYSRRTAEAYLACAAAAGLTAEALAPVHVCLSAQVAGPLRQAGAQHVRVAERPNEPAMLKLLGSP